LAINAHLPEEIRIINAKAARPDFHARFNASGKQYRYFIWNHPAHNPLTRHLAWHVPRELDVASMRKAARLLIGKHDFAAFAANRGYEVESTVRTLKRCDVMRSGPKMTVVIEAEGFLYKMCRGIVGTLVQIGLGKYQPQDIRTILLSQDRRAAGMSAPAHGLVLWRVFYKRAAKPSIRLGQLRTSRSP
jgi:tRNA pseudouridine38-40 synthase